MVSERVCSDQMRFAITARRSYCKHFQWNTASNAATFILIIGVFINPENSVFKRLSKWFGYGTPDTVPEKIWNKTHINYQATTIRDTLHGFKYIIEVDWQKIYETDAMGGMARHWTPHIDFREQYMYPSRLLGNHTIIITMRGIHSDSHIFKEDIFGSDRVFIGTNIKEDATMIALKYK